MVGDGAFSHNIGYVESFKEILNLKGHPDCIAGSKGIAILLNGWILPIGGASLERVCAESIPASLVVNSCLLLNQLLVLFI